MAARDEKHNVRLSKSLSWLLRHNLHLVEEISNTPADQTGYVDVDDVLKLPRFAGYTVDQVKKVVELNDKQRFALRSHPQTGALQIRANQVSQLLNVHMYYSFRVLFVRALLELEWKSFFSIISIFE